jgi:hypothetical protein
MLFVRSVLVLVAALSLCHGESTRKCPIDTVDFATKINQSSVVVYGKTMAKTMNEGSDSIFHVFFQVDCIFKGPATARQINITNAGQQEGKHFCQEFDVGRGYTIAFLEPTLSHEDEHKVFVPADFVETPDLGNTTSELLARTCNLHRLVPLNSVATVVEVCPAVATDAECHGGHPTKSIHTHPELQLTTDQNKSNTTKVLVIVDNGRKTHPISTPQQELDAIRAKSAHIQQVDADRRATANSIHTNSLLVLTTIGFVRFFH